MAVDAHGLPIAFDITGAQMINDCTHASALISKLHAAQSIITDKGYDTQAIGDQTNNKVLRKLFQESVTPK